MTSTQLPIRSSGAPWWGVPRKTSLSSFFRQACPASSRVAAGAARDEPAHAVADDDEILDLDRPCGDQRLQRLGEGAAVGRDVQAGIVGESDRRVAEVVRERRAVVVVLPRPLQVAHAKPVQQHGELAGRVGERLGERLSFERERPAVAAKAHLERQRIAGLGEMVADDAVESGERDLPPARDRAIVRRVADQRRGGADALAGQPKRAADAAIDEPRHPARQPLRERGEAGRVEDGLVHVLDKTGEAGRPVGGEAAEAEGVGERKRRGLRRHGISLRFGLTAARRNGLILSGLVGNRPAAHGATPTRGRRAHRNDPMRLVGPS